MTERRRRPGVMVHLTCAVIGLGGWGEIMHGLKRQPAAPLHADVRSNLSGSSAIQPLAAREEIGTVVFFLLLKDTQTVLVLSLVKKLIISICVLFSCAVSLKLLSVMFVSTFFYSFM